MGLRWDYAAPITELYNRLVNLDIASGYTAIAPVLPGQTGKLSGHIVSLVADQSRQTRCCAAHRVRVAAFPETFHGGSRGIRHLLQHLDLRRNRQ